MVSMEEVKVQRKKGEYPFALYLGNIKKLVCTCGDSYDAESYLRSCPSCGTSNVGEAVYSKEKQRINVSPIFEVVEKHDRGFYIIRQNYRGTLTKDSSGTFSLDVKKSVKVEVIWSLRDKELRYYRNGKLMRTNGEINELFKGESHSAIMEKVSTNGNRNLLRFALNTLGKNRYERSHRFDRGLIRLHCYPMLELMYFAGFTETIGDIFNSPWLKSAETKPHKVLSVPKYMLPFLKKLTRLSQYELPKWRDADRQFGGNNCKTMLEIMEDESSLSLFSSTIPYIQELVESYNYSNVERLMTYLCRDIKLMQGIDSPRGAAVLLRDYVRMCEGLKVTPEKYSKSLKKDHDIAMLNYRAIEDAVQNKRFSDVMNSDAVERLLTRKKDYVVTKPTLPKDLIDEGKDLNHCVASYVKDVVEKRCIILFVRHRGVEDESLLTIELRGGHTHRGLRVVQARGTNNRKPTTKEKDFIMKWADEKGIIVNY